MDMHAFKRTKNQIAIGRDEKKKFQKQQSGLVFVRGEIILTESKRWGVVCD